MKGYLLTPGTVFAVFAATHFFITYEHWRAPNPDLWSVLVPALIAIFAAALAIWAFRLSRRITAA